MLSIYDMQSIIYLYLTFTHTHAIAQAIYDTAIICSNKDPMKVVIPLYKHIIVSEEQPANFLHAECRHSPIVRSRRNVIAMATSLTVPKLLTVIAAFI